MEDAQESEIERTIGARGRKDNAPGFFWQGGVRCAELAGQKNPLKMDPGYSKMCFDIEGTPDIEEYMIWRKVL